MISWQDLDLNQPIDGTHPLNRGRLAWWLAVPGRLGAPVWWDLVQGLGAVLTGSTSGGWDATHGNPGAPASLNVNHLVSAQAAWNLTSNGPISIALWALPSSLSTSSPFSFGSSAQDTLGQYYFQCTSTAWKVHTTHGFLSSSFAPSITRWDRLVLTYDGSVNSNFYVNGVWQSSFTTAFGVEDNTNVYLGSGDGGVFRGWINDLSVWNRPLSGPEVLSEYWLSQQGYPGVLRYQSPEAIDLLLSPSGSTSSPFVLKPFVSRPRFEPAYFE